MDWMTAKAIMGGSTTGPIPILDKRRPNLNGERSNGSLFSTMERFIKAVDIMGSCVLIPSKLVDQQLDPAQDKKLGQYFTGTEIDLFQLFLALRAIKFDLMWGSKMSEEFAAPPKSSQSQTSVSNGTCPNGLVLSGSVAGTLTPQGQNSKNKGHVRSISVHSTSSNSSEMFHDLEDSGIDEDQLGKTGLGNGSDGNGSITDSFHFHLGGLQKCLQELTYAAEYVSNRYNDELCAASEF